MSRQALRVITNSEQRAFRRCAREHLYAYEQRYRPVVEADTLRFGTLIHRALEAYWRRDITAPRLARALTALEAASDPFEAALARALLIGYDARWQDDDFEVIGVEVEFTAPLINPATDRASKTFMLGGKLDVLVRRAIGVFIMEHKTSSEDLGAGSNYWARLRIDSQISTYYTGARALGHEIVGAIYDVLARPQLRPLKATPIEDRKYTKKDNRLYANQRETDETPDEYELRVLKHIGENVDRYYHRGDVVCLEAEEREAQFDTWQVARLIREAELAQRYPRNADACVRYGRLCDFFSVCTGAASLDDPTRFRRTETAHEELSHASTSTADAANDNATNP